MLLACLDGGKVMRFVLQSFVSSECWLYDRFSVLVALLHTHRIVINDGLCWVTASEGSINSIVFCRLAASITSSRSALLYTGRSPRLLNQESVVGTCQMQSLGVLLIYIMLQKAVKQHDQPQNLRTV